MTAPVAHPPACRGSEGRAFDPRARNLMLLEAWENDNPSVICTPHGNVIVSEKCMAQGFDEGRAFVAALVRAANESWQEELRPARA